MLPKLSIHRLSLSVNGFNSNSIIRKTGEVSSCPNITFEDDNFKAVEESGKPGNYNISPSLGDDTSYKSAVAKITFIVPKSGNTTHFRSTILIESDLD